MDLVGNRAVRLVSFVSSNVRLLTFGAVREGKRGVGDVLWILELDLSSLASFGCRKGLDLLREVVKPAQRESAESQGNPTEDTFSLLLYFRQRFQRWRKF